MKGGNKEKKRKAGPLGAINRKTQCSLHLLVWGSDSWPLLGRLKASQSVSPEQPVPTDQRCPKMGLLPEEPDPACSVREQAFPGRAGLDETQVALVSVKA